MATGFAGQGGSFGSSTVSGIGGAVSDLFSSEATAKGLRLKAQGDIVEGENYSAAAVLAKQNENFTEQSTQVQQVMADRQIQQGIGTTKSEVAGAGFAESGSALDILRSGAQQGALQKQLIGQQGLITEAGYNEQAEAYTRLASYANYSADVQNQMADTAETTGEISAGITGAAAIASMA